jgi:hypothetical protein
MTNLFDKGIFCAKSAEEGPDVCILRGPLAGENGTTMDPEKGDRTFSIWAGKKLVCNVSNFQYIERITLNAHQRGGNLWVL